MPQPPNIAIVSGEISGDLVGGALARELKALRPDVTLWGIGSRHMAAAGVELLYDSSEWSAISVVETLKLYPKLRWTAYPRVVEEAAKRRPAVIVLIDFGAFNVKVAYKARALGIPVLYYFPPGSWKRAGRVKAEIAAVTDRILTQFPWSEERLRSVGANAEFVGHPLVELVKPTVTKAEFADRFGMNPNLPIIGLLPGSRGFEVEHNTPAMLGAADLIVRDLPGAQFVFGVASGAARSRIEAAIEAHARKRLAEQTATDDVGRLAADVDRQSGRGKPLLVTPEGVTVDPKDLASGNVRMAGGARYSLPPIVLAEGLGYDVMAHSDALLVCSGTATLEAALLGTPMAILYRGSRLMYLEANLRRIRPEHFGMPNIIADRRIVPEFLQDEATPEALAGYVLQMLHDPAARAATREDLRAVRSALLPPSGSTGTEDPSRRAAQRALELAGLMNADMG
jgi:lipid-A-disaccharide synthase